MMPRKRVRDIDTGLTAERLRELLDYDASTGEFRWRVSRGNAKAGSVAGRPHDRGYLCIGIDGFEYYAHRLAWLHAHGVWPVAEIDHRDGDTANTRLNNLREATRIENVRNTRAHRDNALGVRGVSLNPRCPRRPYQLRITHNGKSSYRSFRTLAEAAKARESAASLLFGEFAPTRVLEMRGSA